MNKNFDDDFLYDVISNQADDDLKILKLNILKLKKEGLINITGEKLDNEVRTSLVINDFDKKIIDELGKGMTVPRNGKIVRLLNLFYFLCVEYDILNYFNNDEIRNVVLATDDYKKVFLDEISKLEKLYSFNSEMLKYCDLAKKSIDN